MADDAKKLLSNYNKKAYSEFCLNEEKKLTLPKISLMPGIIASSRPDIYEKKISHTESDQHIRFITKNGETHAFLWQSTAGQLKKAVRWGIVKTHSITGKVISTLGQYRVIAHERVAKGMVSNSQAVKLKLLDLYQDRFEALQDIESLVNKDNTYKKYQKNFKQYIQKLELIRAMLLTHFADIDTSGLDEHTLRQLHQDITNDIVRAEEWVRALNKTDLASANRARGQDSVMEFVKQQMTHGLYELQGINQDITYSNQRYFALTRGELNDYIEDARKDLDDHQADLRNHITPKHHGVFSAKEDDLVTYDFSEEHLTPARQREALLAISFIEGWDRVENEKGKPAKVVNANGSETLDTIAATRWKNHRSLFTTIKSVGFFIFNTIKSLLVETRPWEEETWKKPEFHLVATELRKQSNANEPMWKKPLVFFKQIFYAVVDLFKGIRNFGHELIVKLPFAIIDDWRATKELQPLADTLKKASGKLKDIIEFEGVRLAQVLKEHSYSNESRPALIKSRFAKAEYDLTAGEQNDILTAMARGLNEFSSVFTHNIYAKDPVAGVIFTAAYGIGAGVIFMPALSTSLFGANYVNWFTHFSHAMGTSKLTAAVGGGCTQAQAAILAWDGAMHGPNSIAMNALYQFGEDPLTIGAYCCAAYGLGYLLVNGIAGHAIPWISESLKGDLGTDPETGYPFIGAKFAILFVEALITQEIKENPPVEFSEKYKELKTLRESLSPEEQKKVDQFALTFWLATNANILSKLNPRDSFAVERQIDNLFEKNQAKSLKKLLNPDKPLSIATQLFTIPLSYIPAILRFGMSFLLSSLAWIKGHPHAGEPIKRALTHLVDKTIRDLSRLVTFASEMIFLAYSVPSSVLKAIAFTANMFIGRLAGLLLNKKTGHVMHQGFAAVHGFARKTGEFLYPVRLVESAAIAHSTSTIKATEHSYCKLMGRIDKAHQPANNPQFIQPVGSFPALFSNFESKKETSKKKRSACVLQ